MTTHENTKQVLMMIGLPGVGKSTFISQECPGWRVVSSDAHVERHCKDLGLTYNEGFSRVSKAAFADFETELNEVLASGEKFILDQTNLSVKSRAAKISKFKKHGYTVSAIKIDCDRDVHERYLAERKDKTIPQHVMDNMRKSYQSPWFSEGFDYIEAWDTSEGTPEMICRVGVF